MEEELFRVILWHSRRYPEMKPADYIKLLYQNEFGCAHAAVYGGMSTGKRDSGFLSAAEEETPRKPRMEPIGNGLCRVFLGSGRRVEPPSSLLNLLFGATAKTHLGNRMRFQKKLVLLREMASKHLLTVELPELDLFLERYASSGGGPVSHSPGYKKAYRPHYRVVKESYYDFFPVFQAAMRLRRVPRGGRPSLLAIDGRCGSGKTFLAERLAEVFGCSVFHMDDFFLKAEERTARKMAEPGGNIDRGRFLSEVLRPLKNGESVRFRPYSRVDDTFLPAVEQRPGAFAVVEGSYSLHPDFRDFYDCRVFLTCLPNAQQKRILVRSGGKMLHDDLERWIPMEEHYFERMKIDEICDLQIDTSAFRDGTA